MKNFTLDELSSFISGEIHFTKNISITGLNDLKNANKNQSKDRIGVGRTDWQQAKHIHDRSWVRRAEVLERAKERCMPQFDRDKDYLIEREKYWNLQQYG